MCTPSVQCRIPVITEDYNFFFCCCWRSVSSSLKVQPQAWGRGCCSAPPRGLCLAQKNVLFLLIVVSDTVAIHCFLFPWCLTLLFQFAETMAKGHRDKCFTCPSRLSWSQHSLKERDIPCFFFSLLPRTWKDSFLPLKHKRTSQGMREIVSL